MLCAQEEMEMANSQGKKEEITLAAIFCHYRWNSRQSRNLCKWESACVMMWH
jgi:hypothetical protein